MIRPLIYSVSLAFKYRGYSAVVLVLSTAECYEGNYDWSSYLGVSRSCEEFSRGYSRWLCPIVFKSKLCKGYKFYFTVDNIMH